MRLAVILRVTLYLLGGCAVALGMLAVRTYPAERTWADAAVRWKEHRDMESEIEPRILRRACGWRVLFCDELPEFRGPLAGIADSLFTGVERFVCVPGMGWRAFQDGRVREVYCSDSMPDSPLWVATDLDGSVKRVTHRHGADSQRSEFSALKQQYVARLGATTLCPSESESRGAVRLRWQVGPVIRMLEHTDWDGLVESWEVGRGRCWLASPEY